ncbi:MAG: NADH-quinone oxidoreductase subunit H [Bacillota bacterium]|nr:NADH-quinone oxidoreductase subunit H [Bacillota bacterium]
MGVTIATVFLQGILLVLIAPLIQGIIKKTKARLQSRIGPGIFQPYYDLFKYLRKDAVISSHASWLTIATPYIAFTAVLTAGLLVPTFITYNPLGFMGDILLIVYLFGMARFFTALTALDAGGSFGGMGSSREMAFSAIAEPALLLAVFAVLLPGGGTTKLSLLIEGLTKSGWSWLEPSYILAFIALFIVVIVETGRIPFDNPDTHLELTMIHEGMLLEYSGRYLGLMFWAAQMKQVLILSLFINLFFPWGIALDYGPYVLVAVLVYVVKLIVLGCLLAVIETMFAKMRLFKVPKLLFSSMLLSLLAMMIWVFE